MHTSTEANDICIPLRIRPNCEDETLNTNGHVSPTGTFQNRYCRPSESKRASKFTSILLAIVVGFLLVATIVLAVLYLMERNKTSYDQIEQGIPIDNSNLCLTPYCIKAANKLLESIDETVDPCENFYQFTCGTWIKNTKISPYNAYESTTRKSKVEMNDAIVDLLSSLPPNGTIEPKAITNARRLYNSCIDEDAIKKEYRGVIRSLILEEFGGWPLGPGSIWNESMFNLSHILLKLIQYNNFAFYHVETTIDDTDASTYRIQISPARARYTECRASFEKIQFTKAYERFRRDLTPTMPNNQSTTDAEKTAIREFVEKISEYLTMSETSNSSKDIITTVRNLSQTIRTDFDFSSFVRRLYLLGNVTLNDDDIVIVNDIDAIRNISFIIAQQSPHILQKYMIVQFILSQYFHIPEGISTFSNPLNKNTSDILEKESRPITCAKYVNRNMEFAVSKLYIKKYFDKLARNEAVEIVNNIRNIFIDKVNQSLWMDTISKKTTIEKAQTIVVKVGYPDYLDSENMTKLENIYAENVLTLLQLNVKENFQKLRKPVDRSEWINCDPTTINAYHVPLFNQIIIPISYLQPPYFHKDAPKYLNYAAIGTTAGHEIMHGFDEPRRHIDKDGKRYTLWSNETNKMFDKRSKCLIDQYNNYTVSQINLQVDGYKTLNENIADNDGLKKAFYAYQKWHQTHKNVDQKLPGFTKYSAEQMFFISFGQKWCTKMTDFFALYVILNDDHSPAQFRVNGPTSNFDEFDRAFKCKRGQGNSRVNKCSVW